MMATANSSFTFFNVSVENGTDTAHVKDTKMFLVRNLVLGIMGVFLSGSGILFLSWSKKLKLSLKVTLLSSSCNDLLFMTTAIFFGIPQWTQSTDHPACLPILFMILSSILLSSFTTALLSVHNYIAVFHPFHCNQIITNTRAILAVVGVYMFGYVTSLGCLGIPIPTGFDCFCLAVMPIAGIWIASFLCVICFIVSVVINVKMFMKVRRRRNTIHASENANDQNHSSSFINRSQMSLPNVLTAPESNRVSCKSCPILRNSSIHSKSLHNRNLESFRMKGKIAPNIHIPEGVILRPDQTHTSCIRESASIALKRDQGATKSSQLWLPAEKNEDTSSPNPKHTEDIIRTLSNKRPHCPATLSSDVKYDAELKCHASENNFGGKEFEHHDNLKSLSDSVMSMVQNGHPKSTAGPLATNSKISYDTRSFNDSVQPSTSRHEVQSVQMHHLRPPALDYQGKTRYLKLAVDFNIDEDGCLPSIEELDERRQSHDQIDPEDNQSRFTVSTSGNPTHVDGATISLRNPPLGQMESSQTLTLFSEQKPSAKSKHFIEQNRAQRCLQEHKDVTNPHNLGLANMPSNYSQSDAAEANRSDTGFPIRHDSDVPTNSSETSHRTVKSDGRSPFERGQGKLRNTLMILTIWSCMITFPFLVYMIYLCILNPDARERDRFTKSKLGILTSTIHGIGGVTNPLLVAWRFIQWRRVLHKCLQRICGRPGQQ